MTIDEADIIVPEGVKLLGAKAGMDVVSAGRAIETDPDGETIIVQSVTLSNNAQIDGVTLKAKPIISTGVEAVSINNSRLLGIDTPTSGDHLSRAVISLNQWDTPAIVTIDGNYFGNNTGVYNVFELNVPLANGTSISNNSFAAAAGDHNIINIYAADNNTVITIKDNHFDKAANGIRLGTKGAVNNVVVNIEGNDYDATDTGVYAGLLLVQPYAKATTDMGGVTINLDNTINNSGESQLWYYYAGTDDAQLTNDQKPKVYIDGNLQPYTI